MAEKLPSQTIKRMFDDGGRLVLFDNPRADGVAVGFVLGELHCENPDCPCRATHLHALRLERSPVGEMRAVEGRRVTATLDIDSGDLTLSPEGAEDGQDLELLDLMRRKLAGNVLHYLRARWQRVKNQHLPDEWRRVDWSGIDLNCLVPYLEAFPSQWDLSAESDGQRYWVLDSWCMNPACTCREADIELLAEEGGSAGVLRVSVDDGRVQTVHEGGEVARRLWKAVLAQKDVLRQLRKRWKAIRRVARALPATLRAPADPPPRTPAVGRNMPCPCGSGKKYKRCCGR